MMIDWGTEIYQLDQRMTSAEILNFIFVTSKLDWVTFSMSISILILNTSALWYVLILLLGFLLAREAIQMHVSWQTYLFNHENWIQMFLIMTFPIHVARGFGLISSFENFHGSNINFKLVTCSSSTLFWDTNLFPHWWFMQELFGVRQSKVKLGWR